MTGVKVIMMVASLLLYRPQSGIVKNKTTKNIRDGCKLTLFPIEVGVEMTSLDQEIYCQAHLQPQLQLKLSR